ncbi:RIO1-domain-containing protein [Lindgomyces ingoldianus]
MKLDVKNIRYLTSDDWRVLTAVEMGSRNHEIVPTPLIAQIASIRSGTGVHRCISALAKIGLIAKVKNAKYDGYRLTYGGLDYLALHTHTKAKTVYSAGNQIGVGKESDIYVCASETGKQLVLKIHRLGRISFRTVKANRDYLRNRSSGSWMYMSRLAALKEFEFMKALRRAGFPVPEPVAHNRHTIIMGLVDAFPMRQISSVGDPAGLYAELISLIVRLAQHGLIHGDFNEFNVLIEEAPSTSSASEEPLQPLALVPTIIDFPQMVSIDHPNAEYYFDRDVACIKRFFSRRFGFTSDEPGPFFTDSTKVIKKRLDVDVEASGFSRKMARELDLYMKEVGVDGDGDGNVGGEEREDDDNDEEEVEDGDETEDMARSVGDEGKAQAPDLETAIKEDVAAATSTQPLASSITILDILDNDPLPSLSEVKPPPKPTISTKAAKAKAGWAI